MPGGIRNPSSTGSVPQVGAPAQTPHVYVGNPLFDPALVQMFANTGAAGASTLFGLGTYDKTAAANAGHGHPYQGPVYTPETQALIAAFNTWKSNTDAGNAAHAEYVKIAQENPGRSATILSDQKLNFDPFKSPTLLGDGRVGKTILGG